MPAIKQERAAARKSGVPLALSLAAVALLAATADAGIFSAKPILAAWNETAVKVDGDASEWKVAEMTEKDGLEVAVANDGLDLYVYVAARDRDTAAQLTGRFKQSFTLWLDAKSAKKKGFGIKITPEIKKPAGGVRQEEPKTGSSHNPAYIVGLVAGDAAEAAPLEGIEFKNGLNRRERPVFEFRIPLEKLTAKAGETVGIGIETSKIDESAMPKMEGGPAGRPGGRGGARGEGFGPTPGGMPGGGGGMGGPGGGNRPGGAPGVQEASLPSPLNFWLKVKLAVKE